MKSFKQYLMESARTYNYTIKIAGDTPKEFMELFRYNLNKFAPLEISDAVTTPIQKDPYGFPHMKNVPVTIMKAKFRYPTTEPMIHQVVQLLGFNVDINCVRVIQTDYNNSINDEMDQYQNQIEAGPLLATLPEASDDAKAASAAYADQYLTSIKDQADGKRVETVYAGKPTPVAADAFSRAKPDARSTSSPLTTITRPGRPKTGAGR